MTSLTVLLPPYPQSPTDADCLQRFSVAVLRRALQLRHLCPEVDVEGIHGTCPSTTLKKRSSAIIRAVLWPPDHIGHPRRLSLSWLKATLSLNGAEGEPEPSSGTSPSPPPIPPSQVRVSALMAAVISSAGALTPERAWPATSPAPGQALPHLSRSFPAVSSPSPSSLPPLSAPSPTSASAPSSLPPASCTSPRYLRAGVSTSAAVSSLAPSYWASTSSSRPFQRGNKRKRADKDERREGEKEEEKEEANDDDDEEAEGEEEERAKAGEETDEDNQVEGEEAKVGQVLQRHRVQQLRTARRVADLVYGSLSEGRLQLEADYDLVAAVDERRRMASERTTLAMDSLQQQNHSLMQAVTTLVANERALMMQGMQKAVRGEVKEQLSQITGLCEEKVDYFVGLNDRLREQLRRAQGELADLKAKMAGHG